jgi:micrococcal nuclease
MTRQHAIHWTAGRWALAVLACATTWSALQAQDAPPPIPKPDAAQTPALPVTRVLEECRIRVRVEREERNIVLCGVLTPDQQPARAQLRRFLENLLKAEAVFVHYAPVSDGDSGDPRPAYVFRAPDGLFVNLEVVRQGYAKVQAEPAGEHLELLRHYEQRASKAHKGVWALPPAPQQVQASDEPAAKPAQDPDELIVYVTKSGKKYHRQGCQYLSKSAIPLPLKEAIRKGYEPCSRCKPPTLEDP